MATRRWRVWSYSDSRGVAYAEFLVDDVAEEATDLFLYNDTGKTFRLTYYWKTKPQPDTFVLGPTTDGGDPPEWAEISFGIPPGQRRWVVLPDGEFDTESAGSTVEMI